MIRLAAIALVGLALFAVDAAAACPDGDYLVVGDPLLSSPGGAFTQDVVTIANGTVAIASGCPAVPAIFRSTTRGTVVRAVWRACGSALRVRLRAVVNEPCVAMRGRLLARRPLHVRRFVARQDPCAAGAACDACTTNDDCDPTRYCAKPPASCDAAGTCTVRPDACTHLEDPVCGCDGATYGNRCGAAAAGTNVAHAGACDAGCDDTCDCYRTRTFPDPCPLDCATCDNYWTCEQATCVPHCGPVPQPAPVCEPRVCGGIAGLPCDPGEFCDLPADTCQWADLQGVCTPIPNVCPDLYAPVCACDGTTHSNECERRMAQAQKARDGACGEKCATACDCEQALPLPSWCAELLCPACGCAWTCDRGRCAVQVETPVPPPACETK
jgi:hypothetical protein